MDALAEFAHTTVLPVPMLLIVSPVLETEPLYQTVLAQPELTTMVMPSVHLVDTDVLNVLKTLITVPLALESEPQLQIVHAQILTMKKLTENVKYVLTDVTLVPTTETTVKFVLETESTSQIVSVHLVLMMMVSMLNVNHVLITVLNVLLKDVPFVVETESTPQLADVDHTTMTTETVNVQNVTINVIPVLPTNHVSLVPLTEEIPPLTVLAQLDSMKTELPLVHHVATNVLPVTL